MEGEADLNDGADKIVQVATAMSLSGQEGVVASIQEGGLASMLHARDTLAAKEAAGMLVPAAHASLAAASHHARQAVQAHACGERAALAAHPEHDVVHDNRGAEYKLAVSPGRSTLCQDMDDQDDAHKQNEVHPDAMAGEDFGRWSWELKEALLIVRATRFTYEILPEEAKVGEDLGAGAAEAQSEAPSENVFSSHFKNNKAGEDLCAVGAEAQSELRPEHPHARSQHPRNFQMSSARSPPTDDRRLRDFYHNWTNSILQQLKRKFWKIADALFRIHQWLINFNMQSLDCRIH
jgi:hypothetical protein